MKFITFNGTRDEEIPLEPMAIPIRTINLIIEYKTPDGKINSTIYYENDRYFHCDMTVKELTEEINKLA